MRLRVVFVPELGKQAKIDCRSYSSAKTAIALLKGGEALFESLALARRHPRATRVSDAICHHFEEK